MDRQALRMANLLVGNAECAAGLEISLIGPGITFERDTVIALGGGDLEATVDHMSVAVWHPTWVPRGSTLRFGRVKTGCRAYLAVAGGLDVPRVFGSRSTYLRAAFGGFEGRALKTGDVLTTESPSMHGGANRRLSSLHGARSRRGAVEHRRHASPAV